MNRLGARRLELAEQPLEPPLELVEACTRGLGDLAAPRSIDRARARLDPCASPALGPTIEPRHDALEGVGRVVDVRVRDSARERSLDVVVPELVDRVALLRARRELLDALVLPHRKHTADDGRERGCAGDPIARARA